MGQSLNILNTKLIKRENKPINLRKSIKSNYIIKTIFSFLKKDIKLYLFHYNKQFQNLSGFNLEDYKKLSGRIKIEGINGYDKEYELETMNLIYKGFYLNGKKNGKGEEFFNDKLIFKGEYLKGKRNGKGLEFNGNNGLIFEGEYLNGKRWNGIIYKNNYQFVIKDGKGELKEFNSNGQLIFEGEYLNGIKKGKEYFDNGELIFEGEYLNEKK